MSLIDQLKTIEDPRSRRGRRHELWLFLFLSLLGSLCNYWGYRPLATFAREHHHTWCDLLNLDPETTRVPSYSTFRQVFLLVDAQSWVMVFNLWAITHAPEYLGQLSTDGKSIKCTSSGGQSHNQNFATLVSVYGQEAGVVQLELMFNKKSSEIDVARRLVTTVVTTPALAATCPVCFSLDALHAQGSTLNLLEQHQSPYLIGLKANQKKLYHQAQQLLQQAIPLSVSTDLDQTHGRTIRRTVQVYDAPSELSQRWAKSGIRRIVWVHRSGTRKGEPVDEWHCYLSNQCVDAATFMIWIRNHWQIENSLHWVKDVTCQEDYPPRRGGQAPISWAILHSFMITLARRMGTRTVPAAMRLLANQVQKVFRWLT
jgi:predicted transposase YbfD/YdcC